MIECRVGGMRGVGKEGWPVKEAIKAFGLPLNSVPICILAFSSKCVSSKCKTRSLVNVTCYTCV